MRFQFGISSWGGRRYLAYAFTEQGVAMLSSVLRSKRAIVDVTDGLPGVTIVGLPDAAVRESKERIRSAIKNSRMAWPMTRVTVNLAPADVRKEGSAFDLSVALGLLAASKQLDPGRFADAVVLGELALDGRLRPVVAFLRGEEEEPASRVPAAGPPAVGDEDGLDFCDVKGQAVAKRALELATTLKVDRF